MYCIEITKIEWELTPRHRADNLAYIWHSPGNKHCTNYKVTLFNSLAPECCGSNITNVIFQIYLKNSYPHAAPPVKLVLGDCHRSPLMQASQHRLKLCLGVIRQQAITWANVDTDLWGHMASLSSNQLKTNNTEIKRRRFWQKMKYICFRENIKTWLGAIRQQSHHISQCWPRYVSP